MLASLSSSSVTAAASWAFWARRELISSKFEWSRRTAVTSSCAPLLSTRSSSSRSKMTPCYSDWRRCSAISCDISASSCRHSAETTASCSTDSSQAEEWQSREAVQVVTVLLLISSCWNAAFSGASLIYQYILFNHPLPHPRLPPAPHAAHLPSLPPSRYPRLAQQVGMSGYAGQEEEAGWRYIKLVLVGESGVGKSNVISRYVENKFSVGVNSTIGLEFSEKHVNINAQHIVLQLWDTAGQERFRALNKTFYANALGALVVFDLTQRQTFEQLPRWLAEMRENMPEQAVLLLLGNKCDLKEQTVTVAEASEFARREGMGFLQTSAATAANIREAFELLTRKIVEQVMEVKEFQMKTVKQKPARIQPIKRTASERKQEKCCK